MPGALTDTKGQQASLLDAPRPSYKGRRPASPKASAAARGSSKKTDTSCELLLRRAVWALGFRYRKDVQTLPGRPDIVFFKAKVAVFCDGDFWHGRDWESRRQKLARGTNPDYWIAKIQRNMERDRQNTLKLEEMGWMVLRFWESEIRTSPSKAAERLAAVLGLPPRPSRRSPLDNTERNDVNRA
jgi:DNA mismatch endonuclease, patch repair protein